MKFPILAILLLFLFNSAKAQEWKVTDLAQPKDGVADPDHILREQHRLALAERLQDLELTISVDDEEVEIQMALAVVERMNMKDYDPEVSEEEVAEIYARKLHDTWGVGHTTSSGGTGVLIFLSVYDRVVYVSRGAALDCLLSNARVDTILAEIRPSLKQAKYAESLAGAIDMVVSFIQQGDPTWQEQAWDLVRIENVFLLGWLAILVNGLWQTGRRRQEQRAYAEAASHLSEIDRIQAQALQGQYEATSCPICLESFKSTTIGSDDQPIKLLRCGHVFDENCWSEWVSSGQGNVTKCPICKMDIGGPQPESSRLATTAQQEGVQNNEAVVAQTTGNQPEGRDDQEIAIRRWHQERNFRLVRLGSRFPSYLTQRQINEWSSPTYNGSLARDPSFQQRNPQHSQVAMSSQGGGHGGSISFGGGSSGGGRGGRF